MATGSSPTRIPAFDLPTHRVMDSTGALELPDVPESLLVVGGGYIGLEMGTVYAALGSKVSVVEMTDGLLPGADRDLVRPLQKQLQGIFEAIYLNTKVAALADKTGLDRGDVRGRRAGESAAVQPRAAVRRPAAEQHRAGAGEDRRFKSTAAASSRSIGQRRTADPHILAIGDVAGEPMLAHKAAHEGKTAVEAIAGQAGGVRAEGDSRRRLHRSRNRLGRTDGNRGQAAGPPVRGRPNSPGRPAAAPRPSAAPKG